MRHVIKHTGRLTPGYIVEDVPTQWPSSVNWGLRLADLLPEAVHVALERDDPTQYWAFPEVEPEQRETKTDPPPQRTWEMSPIESQIVSGLMMQFVGANPTLPAFPIAPTGVDIGAMIAKQSEQITEVSQRLGRVESDLQELTKKIEWLRTQGRAIWVPVQSLAPDPYELLRPITVVVTLAGEEFEASFFDANLYGSGDTEEEAVSDLKSVIVETFERLSALPDEKLGPAMLKQKRVLGVYMK
jgi:hypothetical protein